MLNRFKQVEPAHRFYLLYVILAGFSLFLTYNLPYRFEEANYTLMVYEMWHNHHFFTATINGIPYARPPLMLLWPIGVLSSSFGWIHLLPCARLVTAVSTLITTYLIGKWIALYETEPTFKWLAMACFLTGDLLFMRGWLAYTDPMFMLYLFLGQYLMFAADYKKKSYLLLLSHFTCLLAFFTKAYSALLFHSVSYCILCIMSPNKYWLRRQYLSHCTYLFITSIIVGLNYLFNLQAIHGVDITDRIYQFYQQGFLTWAYNTMHVFLTILTKNLLMLTMIFVLCIKHSRALVKGFKKKPYLILLGLIGLINCIPFVVIQSHHRIFFIRYLLPIYPTIAIVTAYVVYYSKSYKLSYKILATTLLIKCVLLAWGYPFLVKKTAANTYRPTATQIVHIVKNKPLFTEFFVDYPGSIAIWINIMRPHAKMITDKPYHNIPKDSYYMNIQQTHPEEQVAAYTIGKHKFFLNKKK